MAEKTIYDVIVVGSGAAGGLVGWRLCEQGAKVLLLEAGPRVDPTEDFRRHRSPWSFRHRGFGRPGLYPVVRPAQLNEYTEHLFVNSTDWPYSWEQNRPYNWVRVRAMGGRSLLWEGVTLRMSERDFKPKSTDGYGEDWPLGYADIAPYYDRVEKLIGVCGSIEGLSVVPDGQFLKPLAPRCAERLVARGCEKLSIRCIPLRKAVLTQDWNGRPACHYCGECNKGCDTGAMYTSLAILPRGLETRRLTIQPNSLVHEVLTDSEGKASGVGYLDRLTRKSYEAYARVVVLSASTVESARILLLSKSRRFPNGLANSSGQVGKNLIDHVVAGASGFLKPLKGAATTNEDGAMGHIYIPRFVNLDKGPGQYIRGFGYQAQSGCSLFPNFARSLDGFGVSLKKTIRELYPSFVGLAGFGEVLPTEASYFDLDPHQVDAWGLPVPRFHVAYGPNESAMVGEIRHYAEEILRAAGAELVPAVRAASLPGSSIHELGACRMGTDPKKSVLNQFCQSHDVKNLFVMDGGSFPSASEKNPTLTIMALAWRGCDYLIESLKKGDL